MKYFLFWSNYDGWRHETFDTRAALDGRLTNLRRVYAPRNDAQEWYYGFEIQAVIYGEQIHDA